MSRAALARQVRQYGFPYLGLVNTLDRHEVPLGALTDDSHDCLIVPGRRPDVVKVCRRQGAAGVGAATGVLEMPVADATMRGQELFELASPSITDGYPTHGVLFADEANRFGQVYLRDTNTSIDYTLGEDFGATHYPTAASTVSDLKMIPLPYDGNGATGLTRFAYEDNRRRHCGGARRRQGVRNWEYFPGYCPSKWNRAYNPASGSGSNKVRISPAGHAPPLYPPSFPAASYPTRKATAAPWAEGDTFFASYMYQWEDDSFSMPFIPRDKNTTLTAGLGLVVVDDDGDATAEYFDFIPWRNIPVPPPGVKKVWLLRSPKVSKTLIAAGNWPAINDLRVVGYVPAGTTSYDDPNGNDLSLVADTARVRFDHKWPDSARYIWTFDQRVAQGYLKPNPCCIIIAPTGSAVSRDLNGNDDANPGSVFFHTRVYSSGATLELHLRCTTGGATTTTAITLSASKTLQQVVDEVNATVVGGAGREWAAALVPGVQGSLPSTYLALQSVDLACATTNTSPTVTSAALFGDVAEGMKVTGTGIPAGTYVKSKASASSLTLSANATATGAPTLTFAVDTGDGGICLSTDTGNVRAYSSSYWAVLPFKGAYLATLDTNPRDYIFTGGGPTHAPYAANNYYEAVGNRRTAEREAGVFMGGAPLRDGCVLFYSNRIYWLRNTRSGGSGEDADYRSLPLEFARGCISPYSIVYGNGWAGCMTADGFWCFDGERTVIISGDVLDRKASGMAVGELAYEVEACAAAAKSDGTDFRLYAHFRDGRLWLNYRTAAAAYATICYDASPSVESAGCAQLLRGDGTPYGWSPRLKYSWRGDGNGVSGCLGSVQKSNGVALYGCDDKNDKTNCGLVHQFETRGNYLDGATPVDAYFVMVTDLCGTLKKKSAKSATFVYRLGGSGTETATVTIYTRQDRTASGTRTLGKTPSTDFFSRKVLYLPPACRSSCECLEIAVRVNGLSTTTYAEFSGVEVPVDLLDSLN